MQASTFADSGDSVSLVSKSCSFEDSSNIWRAHCSSCRCSEIGEQLAAYTQTTMKATNTLKDILLTALAYPTYIYKMTNKHV